MHVLVTGGAGFVGSHLVDSLLDQGHQVTALDNFDPFYARVRKEQNIALHRTSPRYALVEADICDLAQLRACIPRDVDVIAHLAAKAGVRPSIEQPLEYQDVNVRGTHHLLEVARERGIGQFVFASSSSVYGVNPRVPWREDDSVLAPISPYASTKVSAELLGHVYSHLFGIRFIALRLFTVYGPRQRPDLAIHKFASLMLEGQPIPLFGDGSTRRDYTYVGDVVAGIRAALDYRESMFEVINIGNNRTVTLLEMVDSLARSLGVEARLTHRPEQAGDVPQTWADVSKARRLLGFVPGTSFQEGVGRFADWLRASSPGGR